MHRNSPSPRGLPWRRAACVRLGIYAVAAVFLPLFFLYIRNECTG